MRKKYCGILKIAFVFILLLASLAWGRLTIDDARKAASRLYLGSYSYHEQFLGHAGYGAPVILTADGGAAAFGGGEDNGKACCMLVRMDTNANVLWTNVIFPEFDEMESQSVVQDAEGNFFVFMLSYDSKRYRGGSERVLYIGKDGKVIWDITLGKYTLMDNPAISYIRLEKDGLIALRGHTVKEKPIKGKDPVYRYWEGWLDSKGVLKEKAGKIIDWADQSWKKLFEPE